MNLKESLKVLEAASQGPTAQTTLQLAKHQRYLQSQFLYLPKDHPSRPAIQAALAWAQLHLHAPGKERGLWAKTWTFLIQDFPQAVRSSWPLIILTSVLFLGSVAGSTLYLQQQAGLAWTVASEETRQNILNHQRAKSATSPGEDPTQELTAFYATNNAGVALSLFAGGITGGIYTVVGLINNGLHLGTSLALMGSIDTYETLLNFMAAHAITELLALMIASAGGLVLAHAMLRPGSLSRRQALAKASKQGLKMAMGAALMMTVAAIIESWVSPATSGFTPQDKYTVGAASTCFWLLYFLTLGRQKVR